MKKKLTLITLLALLGTGISLQAAPLFQRGCWRPENYPFKYQIKDFYPEAAKNYYRRKIDTESVKNHYQGKDGGYIRVFFTDWRLGPLWEEEKLLRLKGSYDRNGIFIPAGFKGQEIYQTKPLLKIIEKYWPGRKVRAIFPEGKQRYPTDEKRNESKYFCYITTTDAAFERYKKNATMQKIEQAKKADYVREQKKAQKIEQKKRKKAEYLRKIHK